MVSDSNIDFERAIQLTSKEFSHEQLISLLKNPEIADKQFALLSLEKINT